MNQLPPNLSIRNARLRRGIGVRELARRAGVTPGAVSQWEDSESKGTLRASTLTKALTALGTSPELETQSLENGTLTRREDRVALELHRSVALKLISNPDQVLSVVPHNISLMRDVIKGTAAAQWLQSWKSLAQNNQLGPLVDVMLGTDLTSIAMRQTSPFLGVLSQDERREAIERAAL